MSRRHAPSREVDPDSIEALEGFWAPLAERDGDSELAEHWRERARQKREAMQ